MDRKDKILHHHIRWSSRTELDWECFDTHAQAEARAKQLLRPEETYTIEEHDPACSRCRAALELKIAHPPVQAEKPNVKFPWQQAVLDASTESRPDYLPGKVNAAQRAISARLREKTSAGVDEQIAIRDALNFLRELLPDRTEPEKESNSKVESA